MTATWAAWPGEPGFTGDFAEYLAQTFPTATAADFAIVEAGIVSEETYVQQGLYWSEAYRPLIKYVLDTYRPDVAFVAMHGFAIVEIAKPPAHQEFRPTAADRR